MGTSLDYLKMLFNKMTGKTSKATTTAEALSEIVGGYTKSESGTTGKTVSRTRITGTTSSFISDTGLKYRPSIELGEVNQLYVTSSAGTTASTVFKATGSGPNRTGTLWLPIIYPDSSDNEVVGWFEYTAKQSMNDEGDIEVVLSPVGSPTVDSGRLPMKFVNVYTDSFDIEVPA